MIEVAKLQKYINRKEWLIVFITALVFRLVVINIYFTNVIFNDSYTYHNLAVNIAKGNGYSTETSPPFKPHFLREPAYPYLMGSIYYCVNKFHRVNYLQWNELARSNNGGVIVTSSFEITSVKYVQVFLDSITCIIIFLTLLNFLSRTKAFIIGMLFSLYFPFALHDAFILRETFQTFFAVIFNYFFIKFFLTSKIKYLIGFSVCWGILNLTLQVTLFLGVFIFVFIFLKYYGIFICAYNDIVNVFVRKTVVIFKSFLGAIKPMFFSFVIMLIVVSPNLVRTYRTYPNVRTFLSLGSSLTLQKVNYQSTLTELHDLHKISDSSFSRMRNDLWEMSDNLTFQYSYNGHFTLMCDSLLKKYPLSFKEKTNYFLNNILVNFQRSWFKKFSTSHQNIGYFIKGRNYKELLFYLPGVFVGIFAIGGMLIYFRKYFYCFIIFISFLFLIPVIGSEGRRMLPAHPFIFVFALLFAFYLYSIVAHLKRK